jgi:hypothetical protein
MSKTRIFFRAASVFGAGVIFVGLYVLAICYPQQFFRYTVSHDNIRLYSTTPIPANAVTLLEEVEKRLATSPIYDRGIEERLFACGSAAQFAFFTNSGFKSSALTYASLNRNVFVRPSKLDRNVLIDYRGREVRDDRDLVYYMTHELTHSMTASYIGARRYRNIPGWLREGYADYVGKGQSSFADLERKFHDSSYQTNREYLRYELMTAYLLQVRGARVRDLFSGNYAINGDAAERFVEDLKQ